MTSKMKAIFAATDFELGGVLESKKYGFKRILRSPFEIWKNSSTYIFISGIGPVNASLCFVYAVKNFEFGAVLNVGAAGALREGEFSLGEICLPNRVLCLDPYNNTEHDINFQDLGFEISKFFEEDISNKLSRPCAIASSARVTASRTEREEASIKCDIVDMEAYAYAQAAKLFKRKIAFIKFVSDFSPECDIHLNILRLRHTLENMPLLWI